MKLVTIKTAKETGIPGVEFVITDKNVTEIIIGKVHIKRGESYNQNLVVLIETPFETVDRYRLVGKIEGFPDAVSYHESDHEARRDGGPLEDRGATVTIERVSVSIDDDGNIIDAAVSGQPVAAVTDDQPF